MSRPTALLIPSPWSGDEHDPPPWTYWWWFRLYRAVRVVRHRFAIHDWRLIYVTNAPGPSRRCDWCGARRPVSPTPARDFGSGAVDEKDPSPLTSGSERGGPPTDVPRKAGHHP